jgi:nucleoside-diphosphate-sugar epimerase
MAGTKKSSNGTALVLGATGSFGGALAQELLARGVTVRALVREPAKAAARLGKRPDLELVKGNALDPIAVSQAARGASVVVHGVNYPYDQWAPNMHVATENAIAAAEEAKALIVFPGNVYGLGKPTGAPLTEAAANAPCSAKGGLRVELEDHLRWSAQAGHSRVLILRAGDYFGPTVRNGLVDPIFANALRGRPMQAFGRLDVPHQWAYVPDLARAAADLIARAKTLKPFEVVHFAGHIALPARSFYVAVAAAAGRPKLAVRRVPWWLLGLVGRVKPVVRELMEMRYLFDEALVLDDPRFRQLLPTFKATPLDQAIRDTLDSYRGDAVTPRSGRAASAAWAQSRGRRSGRV